MFRCLLLLSLVFGVRVALAAETTETSPTSKLDELTHSVLADEIQLHRLINRFSKTNVVENIAKKRRQYIWDATNSALTEAGLIDAVHVFFSHSKYRQGVQVIPVGHVYGQILVAPARVSKDVPGSQNAGQFYPQIIGQEFNAAGNAYEIFSNIGFRLHRCAQNLTPSQALKSVQRLVKSIDEHLREIDQINDAPLSENSKSQGKAQIICLHILRNQLITQFCTTYITARKEFCGLNTVEAIDLFRNTIGAIGNQISVRAGYSGNHYLNGLGNVLAEVSAVTITVKPFLLKEARGLNESLAKRQLRKALPYINGSTVRNTDGTSPGSDVAQRVLFANALDSLSSCSKGAESIRQLLTDEEHLLLKSKKQDEDDEHRQHRLVQFETKRDVFTGPTKMVSSGLSVLAQYDSHINRNPTERNRLAAAGNTTYAVGQASNFIALTRQYLHDEIRHQKLKRDGLTNEQQLPEIEKQLTYLSKLNN